MMDGHGWMGFGGIFMILFWVLIIVGIFALVRWLMMSGRSGPDQSRKTPLETLKERYARGEIDQEEYERKRRELED